MNDEFSTKYFIRDGKLYKSCPACSKQLGQDVYYECPERFGYRNKIIQSQCSFCRSNRIGPYEGYTLKNNFDNCIPEIRCLPMGVEEFPTIDDCIDFLTREMPERGNTFYFKKHNLITFYNALILFQYNGMIIGYGFYESESISKFNDYNGYYKFVDNSIYILDEFIPNSVMDSEYNARLGQGTIHIGMSYLTPLLYRMGVISNDVYDYSSDVVFDEIDCKKENDKLVENINDALKKISKVKLFELSNNVILEDIDLDIVSYKKVDRNSISKRKNDPNYFNKITSEYIRTKDSKVIEDYIFDIECDKVRELLCNNLEDNLLKQMKEFYDNRKDIDGYDILSFEKIGGEIIKKFIDVKSTKINNRTPIDLSRNEYEYAKEHINQYYIYRIVIVDNSNLKICEIPGKELFDENKFNIEATEYKIYGVSGDVNS